MNVTVFSPFAAWPPHFETDLELMENHLRVGDSVNFITCDAALSTCDANFEHDYLKCLHCQGKAQTGLALFQGRIKIFRLSALIEKARTSMTDTIPETFTSREELHSFKIEAYDAGKAVLSSLNSHLGDPEPDPLKHAELVNKLLRSGIATYRALQLYLRENRCEKFYVFNGRIALQRAAIRACAAAKVDWAVHDATMDRLRYHLAENTLLHDIEYQKGKLARVVASAASPEELLQSAKEFYEKPANSDKDSWLYFMSAQESGTLPPGWLEADPRVAIYTSTEAEFASIEEYYKNPYYPSQFEGLSRILKDLSGRSFQGTVAVRMHPNSAGTKSDFSERLRDLNYPFLRVIAPRDKVDSYSLLKTSHRVLTFGSTVGIEAAYWGIPSILVGRGVYEHLGSTYNPEDHDDIIRLLLSPLEPKPKDGAILYGYYVKNFGTKFEFVRPVSKTSNDRYFKETKIRPTGKFRYLHKYLPKFPALLTWLTNRETARLQRLGLQK